jgi:Uma2 family endonuclease
MVSSAEHLRLKQTITTLVELVAAEIGLDVDGVGSTTFKKKDAGRGFEADASFYIKNADRVAGKARIDLDVDPPPDLAIEIDITSPSLDKLPIYAGIGVPEVWRYDGAQITILVLSDGMYREQEASDGLPGFTRQKLSELIGASKVIRRSDFVRFVRQRAGQVK